MLAAAHCGRNVTSYARLMNGQSQSQRSSNFEIMCHVTAIKMNVPSLTFSSARSSLSSSIHGNNVGPHRKVKIKTVEFIKIDFVLTHRISHFTI